MTAHTTEAFLPRWRLNRNSDVPLHVQIERLLRKLIFSPPYSSGALLPDELTCNRFFWTFPRSRQNRLWPRRSK